VCQLLLFDFNLNGACQKVGKVLSVSFKSTSFTCGRRLDRQVKKHILVDILCESDQNVILFCHALSLDNIKTIRSDQTSKENSIYLEKGAISSAETSVMRIIWLQLKSNTEKAPKYNILKKFYVILFKTGTFDFMDGYIYIYIYICT
jgi:hypothetical protein